MFPTDLNRQVMSLNPKPIGSHPVTLILFLAIDLELEKMSSAVRTVALTPRAHIFSAVGFFTCLSQDKISCLHSFVRQIHLWYRLRGIDNIANVSLSKILVHIRRAKIRKLKSFFRRIDSYIRAFVCCS